MAYYYVKDDGTATGDAGRHASQQSGSFASLGTANYYAAIANAIAATTAPVAGDFINVSDLHAHSVGAAITYTGIATKSFFIVCVDDANVDAGRTTGNRGKETTTGSSANDIAYVNLHVSGMEFQSVDDGNVQGSCHFSDCKLTSPSSNDLALSILQDGAKAHLENCEIAATHAAGYLFISNGSTLVMDGGSVTTPSAGLTRLFLTGFTGGGGNLRLNGVDLSAVTGTLLEDVGASATSEDIINVHFDMCKLDSGVAFTNEAFTSESHRALFTRCSDVSGDAEFQYHLHALGGDVDDDSTIRRGDDPEFEDSAKDISYKIVTDANASLGSPLWFNFPNARWAALSAGATDTLRFYIASTGTLTDKDIYMCITYPDGTNKQTPNFFSSGPVNDGGTIDFMASGTTLTTDSTSDWRDGGSALTGHNEYQIDVTTSGDVGADTVPNVRVYITKPSVTIQLASIYDLN